MASTMNPCCQEAVVMAIETDQNRIADLEAQLATRPTNAHGDEALHLLTQLLKERRGGEFEWMPTQATWRQVRALLVKTGRL